MTTERIVSDARSDAYAWQAAARNRTDPPDLDTLDRAAVESLGSPGASVASALLLLTSWPPVALNDGLTPSSPPLATLGAVFDHYRDRHRDGAGISLGDKPGGVVLVAVTGTAAAWLGWRDAVAVVRERRDFGDGRTAVDTSLRDLGQFVSVNWCPPSPSFRSSGVTADPRMPRSYGAGESGWLVWAVSPPPGRSVSFPPQRKLGHGLTLIGEGVVPWHAHRRDAWTLRASGVPRVESMPEWLVTALGGRLRKSS